MKKFFGIFLCLLCFQSFDSLAQTESFGLFSSVKGVGLEINGQVNDGAFNTFVAYADIYGLPSGRALFYPGGKAMYFRNKNFKTFKIKDADCSLFWGLGAAAGFVREYEPKKDYLTYFMYNPGVSLAMAADCGLRTHFEGNIDLAFSFSAELGCFATIDQDSKFFFNIYKNGLIRSFYPQISILWKIK